MEVITLTQGERIREIRTHSNLTLERFGNIIGIKKNSVSQLENGKNALTEQTLKSICREFNVSEMWLRTGEGDMFIQPDTFSLDRFAKERGMNEQDLRILKLYFSIDPQKRHDAIDYFLNSLLDEPAKRFLPKTAAELETAFPPEEDTSDKVG